MSTVTGRGHTTRTLNTEASKTSVEFFEQFFPEVLEKGYMAADRMGAIMAGKQVRRTYFFSNPEKQKYLPPVVLHVSKVESRDAGIVKVYDFEETVREFPALMFDFVYTETSVACIGQDFTVLFEVI